MERFRDGELIILIGAGCSADAGIPTSFKMNKNLEDLIQHDSQWRQFKELYYFLKSSILYADGIGGVYENRFDIERLVNVLNELQKKENSILYPFIGSWNPRLLELAGYDFKILKEFKEKILETLKDWVQLEDYSNALYYENFFRLQYECNFSLRIFSLNYDLCFEKNLPGSKDLERGFGDNKVWDWRRFERSEHYEPNIYLYKLHGSIDWERRESEGNIVKEVDKIPKIPDLIFGTNYKLQYIDPYLFYAYELRKFSLEAKLILTIGYSFRDEHINGILFQALKADKERKIMIVSPGADKIKQRLTSNDETKNQIHSKNQGAKKFLEDISIDELVSNINNY